MGPRWWCASSVIAIAAAAGCLDSAPACDDGSLCPLGAVCLPAGGCATPAQVEACDLADELAPCEVQGVGGQQGVCLDGACNFGRCGDGVVEPRLGEVCDLALTADCARDCASDLSCGNGIVDGEVGESCDDANATNHDGCSVRCTTEVATWEPVGTTGGPAAAAAAYDPVRRMVVVFGGYYPNQPGAALNTDTTFEVHRTAWIRRAPLTSPPARIAAAMAFHGGLGQTVLFGGSTSAGPQADTWTYDGATWHALDLSPAPPARTGHLMAYDAGRDRVVLTAGAAIGEGLHDTWEFDGTAWTEGPAFPDGLGPAMAYDPTRGRVVAVAMAPDQSATHTWTYDGVAWSPLAGADLPPMESPGMAFDMQRQQIVVFGGYSPTQGDALGGLWQLAGTTWQDGGDATVLGPRSSPTMVYDPSWAKLLVGGGYSYSGANTSWRWGDQAGWPYGGYPTPYSGGTALWSDGDGLTVVSAGSADLWHRLDATWARTTLATAAPSDYAAPVTYDPISDRLLMVTAEGSPTLEVHSVVDGAWASLPSVGAPPARRAYAIAFDAARGELVLTGGEPIAFGEALGPETWTYNGAAWSPVTPAVVPPPRSDAALAYDPIHQRVVMFGGEHSTVDDLIYYGDTWTFDGATWTEVPLDVHPPNRSRAMLAFDPSRGTMVLLGGNALADAWEFDGTAWRFLAAVATAASYGSLVYDVPRGELLWLQDSGGARLWFATDGVDEACGSGRDLDGDELIDCADPDCWIACTPTCSPVMATAGACDRDDPDAPRCGDDVCAPYEAPGCIADCGAPPAVCGDGTCDATEAAAGCPGDCH